MNNLFRRKERACCFKKRHVFVLCAFIFSVLFSNAQSVLDRELSYLKSTSGRFEVLSSSNAECMELAGWAEGLARSIDRTTGARLNPTRERVMRIVASFSPTPEKAAAGAEPLIGRVSFSDSDGEIGSVRRLGILNFDKADREEIIVAFTHLYLSAAIERLSENRDVAELEVDLVDEEEGEEVSLETLIAAEKKKERVPGWLVTGVAQNLYRETKARNSEVVYRMWQKGMLVSVMNIVQAGKTRKEVCGLFVGMLFAGRESHKLFEAILMRLASDEDVELEWLASLVPGAGSVSELDDMWDKWLLRQKNIIYEPGRLTDATIDQFGAQLLLYRGSFAIPLKDGEFGRLNWRDLIEYRKENWIKDFASSKSMAMTVMAVGRGDRLAEVVEAYNSFLSALSKGKGEKLLNSLLEDAQSKYWTLRDAANKRGK